MLKNYSERALGKVFSRTDIKNHVLEWREAGKTIVFTNGCFDILHRGHVEYLNKARDFGDILIIGVNNDASVRQLKGADRPLVNEDDRAYILSQLSCVDAVVLFSEETPYNLINDIKPDVLVKGGDYSVNEVVGRDVVESSGGSVQIIPLVPGRSTTGIIQKLQKER
jgi:D-beta-D-heptose 7-phosphate kinase/D-beta-D-heptose 1-phosphate adenosyltransferase